MTADLGPAATPRPIPTMEDRMSRPDHIPAPRATRFAEDAAVPTDALDCPEGHHWVTRLQGGHPMHVEICSLCQAINWADLRNQFTANVGRYRNERDEARADLADVRQQLGRAQETLATLRHLDEQRDRAWAAHDTVSEPELDAAADEQTAVQWLLDDSTRAFASADGSSERVEVIRDLLDGWYTAWPSSAVTDPHEGIAWHLVSLVDAAEARASAPSLGSPRRAQETDRLAQAISDPGSILPRREDESVSRWSTRAVIAVLDGKQAERAEG